MWDEVLDGFPKLCEGEILYSASALFARRQAFATDMDFNATLFGKTRVYASILLPQKLEYMVAKLPPAYGYTPDYIIENHTLFRHYQAFSDPQSATKLRNVMLNGGPSSIAGGRDIPKHSTIQMCLNCKEEDTCSGRPYFHREHQVPGIYVCYKHGIPLVSTNIETANQRKYISAHDAIPIENDFTWSKQDLEFNSRLAEDVHSILNSTAVYDIEYLKKCYQYALEQTGYKAQATKIFSDLKQYYSAAFLRILLGNTDSDVNWVESVYGLRHKVTTLKHLLLIQFLGYTLEEFFKLNTKKEDGVEAKVIFGAGPWPCLNPVCDHYNQLVINDYIITNRFAAQGAPDMGIFACSCGFTYGRFVSSSASPEAITPYDRLLQYGHVWESRFREMKDANVSVEQKTQLLGLNDDRTLRKVEEQIVQGDIPVSEWERIPNGNSLYVDKTKLYRKIWLHVIEILPDASLSELRIRYRKIFDWLSILDQQWFNENCPSRKHGPFTDFEKLDQTLSAEITKLATSLQNQPFNRKRISRNYLLIEVGYTLSLFNKNRSFLPKTEAAINTYEETQEQYWVRAMLWSEQQFFVEQRIPSEDQLRRKVGLSPYKDRPIVIKTVDEIMKRFAETGLGR